MLKIGLLGGMSWESSAEYYRLVSELVRERLGGLHSAECLLYSVDFADIELLQHEHIDVERCVGVTQDASRQAYRDLFVRLGDAGAEGVILGCTEIKRLIRQDDVAVPVFPTTRIHAEAAVAQAIGGDQP